MPIPAAVHDLKPTAHITLAKPAFVKMGRMLSGERLTEAALRHAAQLLKSAAGG